MLGRLVPVSLQGASEPKASAAPAPQKSAKSTRLLQLCCKLPTCRAPSKKAKPRKLLSLRDLQ